MSKPLLVIMLTSGCSVIAMRDAPREPTASVPECTDSRAPAGIDLVIGAAFGLFAYSLSGGDADQEANAGELVTMTGAMSALFAGSAVVGFIRARGCDSAKESWRPVPQPIAQSSPPVPPLAEPVAAKHPEAARLTRQAHAAAAAAADDCGPTLANGARVQALDVEYYEKVFVADELIARCR